MACCGCVPSDYDDDIEAQAERRPLLAADEETDRQRTLHAKLHTYQIARALADGYMPSTEQAAAQITKGAASVAALASTRAVRRGRLSPQGRQLLQLAETWLTRLVLLAEHKNGRDQIQEFIWWARRVSMAGAADALGNGAHAAASHVRQPMASAATGWHSLQAIGALLLESTPFKLFLADVADVGRDVFRDTAAATAQAADAAAKNVDSVQTPSNGESSTQPPPADETLVDIADEVAAGAHKVAAEAQDSVSAKLVENDDGTRDRLTQRLRAVVASLSQKPDYATSVSALTKVLQRGAAAYLKSVAAAADNVAAAAEAVYDETAMQQDKALRDIWSFLASFGDEREWKALETKIQRVLDNVGGDTASSKDTDHVERNAKIDRFVEVAGSTLDEALTDPACLDDDWIAQRMDRFRQFSVPDAPVRGLEDDIAAVVDQAKTTLRAALADRDVHALIDTSMAILDVLWPGGDGGSSRSSYVATDLASDAVTVMVPALVQAVRYIPIPRVEVVAPAIDVLLESLILEPAAADDALLPSHVRVQLRNDVDIYADARASALATSVALSVDGLSLQAQDLGYVMRVHKGLLYLLDRGVASFAVSDVCVRLDVDVVRDRAERVLALRRVRVGIGRLDYRVRTSSLSCIAWLLRPLLRPLLRTTLEAHAAASLQAALASANTELVFARERLRGARAAGGGSGLSTLQSLPGLARALLARFQEPVDTDVDVSVGVTPSANGPFDGVYAPGSLVRVWRDEAEAAADRVDDGAVRGWRNAIFDSTV